MNRGFRLRQLKQRLRQNHDMLCRTGRCSLPKLHIQDLVGQHYRLLSRWTISFLKDDLIRHGLAQRGFLFADLQPPRPRARVEQERDFGIFPADEESLGFVIPVELGRPLLGCVH
jgi:hypothetical protein